MTLDPLERKRALNFREACIKARELWGEDNGIAEIHYDRPPGQRCLVGIKGKRMLGWGDTWDEAFAMAEKRGLE